MKRVLIVNCVFYPEPVVSSIIGQNIAESLSRLDYEVTVIAPKPSRPYGFNFVNKIKITDYHLFNLNTYTHPKSGIIGRLRESISFGIASYKFIIKSSKKYDIVYMNTWPLFAQLGVAFACKKSDIDYILHIQDIYPESFVNKLPKLIAYFLLYLLLPIDKFVVRNAYKVIVISDNMKKHILTRGQINDNKISVISNWQEENINNDDYTFNNTQTSLVFMYLGNIGPVSNLPFIIESFFKSGVRAKLIIAGSGSKKQDCEMLVKMLNADNIFFLDVPEGKVYETQQKADILILPTIKNGARSSIPSKLPSYMFSKKPILGVVDKGTDTYEAILNSQSGWLVEPDNKVELMRILKLICDENPENLMEKGKNGYRYAKKYFSKDINLNKILYLFIKHERT